MRILALIGVLLACSDLFAQSRPGGDPHSGEPVTEEPITRRQEHTLDPVRTILDSRGVHRGIDQEGNACSIILQLRTDHHYQNVSVTFRGEANQWTQEGVEVKYVEKYYSPLTSLEQLLVNGHSVGRQDMATRMQYVSLPIESLSIGNYAETPLNGASDDFYRIAFLMDDHLYLKAIRSHVFTNGEDGQREEFTSTCYLKEDDVRQVVLTKKQIEKLARITK